MKVLGFVVLYISKPDPIKIAGYLNYGLLSIINLTAT